MSELTIVNEDRGDKVNIFYRYVSLWATLAITKEESLLRTASRSKDSRLRSFFSVTIIIQILKISSINNNT